MKQSGATSFYTNPEDQKPSPPSSNKKNTQTWEHVPYFQQYSCQICSPSLCLVCCSHRSWLTPTASAAARSPSLTRGLFNPPVQPRIAHPSSWPGIPAHPALRAKAKAYSVVHFWIIRLPSVLNSTNGSAVRERSVLIFRSVFYAVRGGRRLDFRLSVFYLLHNDY